MGAVATVGRLADVTSAVERAVDRLVATDLDAADASEVTALVRTLARIESRLAGVTARAVGVAQRSGAIEGSGATSATTWLADQTGSTTHSAAAAVRLGRALEEAPTLAASVADGSLTADTAGSLARAIDRGVLGPEAVDQLVDEARDLPAGVLARAVRAREALEDHRRLRRDERWARQRRSHSHRRLEDGSVEGTYRLDPLAGELWLTAVQTLATPDPADVAAEDQRTRGQREADAIEALARLLLDGGTADTGATVRPHVTVVVPVAALHPDGETAERAGALGTTDRGTVLSTATVRQLLCDATVRRLVVDPEGRPLDVGRATRTWSGAQRAASAAVDGGCRGPSCDRPFGWTQLHHIDWWSRGGRTDLDRAVPLCTHCHHLVHDDGWTVDLDAPTRIATWTSPGGQVVTTRARGPAGDLARPPGRADPPT